MNGDKHVHLAVQVLAARMAAAIVDLAGGCAATACGLSADDLGSAAVVCSLAHMLKLMAASPSHVVHHALNQGP